MSTTRKNFMIRGVLLIISLVLIIFTGREKNEDGVNKLAFSDHGRESFRLGMDVAGGTRLTYKIDYSKYKEQYPDQFSFNQAKQDAETVILQQVDSRISKLGVSDYTAKPVTLDNEHYMQIEL
jgi:preprotein translocase subunit SecD